MFTFTNPFLLWAFPILLLPWIFRRRQEERIQKVHFALIHLLMESEEKDLINPRLQELLLLILRTLLLLLLLLALSGPKWNPETPAARSYLSFLPVASSVQSSVVIVDSSYSMGYGEGESSWWNRSLRTAERVDSNLSGFNTSWLWWNRETLEAIRANEAPTLSFSDLKEMYERMSSRSGSSVNELLSVLQDSYDEETRLILITDGQRKPWAELLETEIPSNLPPLLVISIGEPGAQNTWIEVNEWTSPPWGIAISESVAGRVSGLNANQSGTLSVYDKDSGKSIYSQSVQFTIGNENESTIPFHFDLDPSAFFARDNSPENATLFHLMLELDTGDTLQVDNRQELNMPIVGQVQFGVGYDAALPPVELRFLTAALSDNVEVAPMSPPNFVFTNDMSMALLAGRFVPWWAAGDTMKTIEYVKNGGNLLVFTGVGENSNTAWNNLLEELGWTWADNTEIDDFRNLAISGGGDISNALQAWETGMWDAWKPPVHGRMNAEQVKPVVTYQSGDSEYHLITEAQIGKGTLWLVNADLQAGADNVWSPILPSLIWESAKQSVRSKMEFDFEPPQPRWESNLTVLTDEDKQSLNENYGIQFAQPEDAANQLNTIYGGLDLRYLLLMLTIFTALVESWLANRLASL